MIELDKYTVNEKKEKKLLIIIIALFFAAMFFCSASTSPLYPDAVFGGDSVLFTLCGKGMANGKLIYRDLFDHKGPILFFIEALGYRFGGTVGIFILQCLLGAVNLVFTYAIWKRIRNSNNRYIVDLIFMLLAGYSFFSYTFTAGNLTEEYSLPFISVCVYLFVKYALDTDKDRGHPCLYSFFYGVLFTCLAFIRVNNGVTILAGAFAIILFLIYKKQYKNLLLNILFGLLGCAAVTAPIFIYCYANSILYDMLYATFIYNFKYAGSTGHQSIIHQFSKVIILYIPILFSVFLIVRNFIKTKKCEFIDFLISVIFVLNAICLIWVNMYAHYFTVFVPVFMLVLAKYFSVKKIDIKMIVLCGIVLICLARTGYTTAVYLVKIGEEKAFSAEFKTEFNMIPEEEKDSVIGYNISSKYYMLADILPCYKYYTMQEWWSKDDPSIKQSFVEFIDNGGALWLITAPDEDDAEVLRVIENRYIIKNQCESFNLYRLKE